MSTLHISKFGESKQASDVGIVTWMGFKFEDLAALVFPNLRKNFQVWCIDLTWARAKSQSLVNWDHQC